MRLIHAALAVSDLDASLAFYGTLGLARTHEFTLDGVRNVYVGADDGLELQLKYDPGRTEPVSPDGIDHVACEVDDVDAEFERVVDATDCPVVREPFDVAPADARAAFVEDPDGYVVELVAYTG